MILFDTLHIYLEPWLSVCGALSGSVASLFWGFSVGALSGLCRLTTVEPLSAYVGLCHCRPLSADPDRYFAWNLSTCVGLSRPPSVCGSVGLWVSVDELSEYVGGSQCPFRVKLTSLFNPKAPF